MSPPDNQPVALRVVICVYAAIYSSLLSRRILRSLLRKEDCAEESGRNIFRAPRHPSKVCPDLKRKIVFFGVCLGEIGYEEFFLGEFVISLTI